MSTGQWLGWYPHPIMPKARVAFSVDPHILDRLEKIRAKTGESRSAMITRALSLVTDHDARNDRVHRYVDAYRKRPETGKDEAAARSTARRALVRLEWDKE